MVSFESKVYNITDTSTVFPLNDKKIAFAFPTQRWAAQLESMNDHEST